jgi:hypothetical protein
MWDVIFVYIGVAFVWLLKGCKYSLSQELKRVRHDDFFRRREGLIGLAIILAIGAVFWTLNHFFG